MSSRALLVLASLVALAACDSRSPYPRPADPVTPREPVEHALSVGTHQIRLTLPAKWSHRRTDDPATHRFKRSIGVIGVADLGPITREGIFDAVRRARQSSRGGSSNSARIILQTVDPAWLVAADAESPHGVEEWNRLLSTISQNVAGPAEIEATYDQLLTRALAFPAPQYDRLVDEALGRVGHDRELREVASLARSRIDGFDAWRVETWNRRNHTVRRACFFVVHQGYLFVLRTELGDLAELAPAFDLAVDTLRFE